MGVTNLKKSDNFDNEKYDDEKNQKNMLLAVFYIRIYKIV